MSREGDRIIDSRRLKIVEPTYVYFIQCTETKRIKIGSSADPYARLSQLQTSSPTPLRILAVIEYSCCMGYSERTNEGWVRPGDVRGKDLEKSLHWQFSSDKERGEWFRLTRGLMQIIEEAGQVLPGDIYPIPTLAEVIAYCQKMEFGIDPGKFMACYEARRWTRLSAKWVTYYEPKEWQSHAGAGRPIRWKAKAQQWEDNIEPWAIRQRLDVQQQVNA